MRRLVPRLAVFLLMAAGGCAATCPYETPRDWYERGLYDGTQGRSRTYIESLSATCARYDRGTDVAAWMRGWRDGLRTFCTWRGGYNAARKGGNPNPLICPASRVAEVRRGIARGEHCEYLQDLISDARHDLSVLERNWARIETRVRSTRPAPGDVSQSDTRGIKELLERRPLIIPPEDTEDEEPDETDTETSEQPNTKPRRLVRPTTECSMEDRLAGLCGARTDQTQTDARKLRDIIKDRRDSEGPEREVDDTRRTLRERLEGRRDPNAPDPPDPVPPTGDYAKYRRQLAQIQSEYRRVDWRLSNLRTEYRSQCP